LKPTKKTRRNLRVDVGHGLNQPVIFRPATRGLFYPQYFIRLNGVNIMGILQRYLQRKNVEAKREAQQYADEVIEAYRIVNHALEDENEKLKAQMLDYRVMKMYVNDDPAILEILDAEKKNAEAKTKAERLMHLTRVAQSESDRNRGLSAARQAQMNCFAMQQQGYAQLQGLLSNQQIGQSYGGMGGGLGCLGNYGGSIDPRRRF
jgi:hypothetical protein